MPIMHLVARGTKVGSRDLEQAANRSQPARTTVYNVWACGAQVRNKTQATRKT